MKIIWKYGIFCAFLMLFVLNVSAQNSGRTTAENSRNKKAEMRQILIDRFIVPDNSKEEFLRRMKINREFIKTLSGFVKDTVYQQTGRNGESNFVTIVVWKNEKALENAKREVAAKYKKQNFDMPVFLERLNIKIERAIYRELEDY